MKTQLETAVQAREKHTPFEHGIPQICIIDKRGRVLWNSDDPKDEHGMAGQSIIDHIAESEKKRVLDLLTECLLMGNSIEYDVVGEPGPQATEREMISWRVKMWPADHGDAAACCICYRLDPAYQEIKEDEITLLRHLCEDCTLIECAHRMLLSESAIDAKIKKLKEKLRCHNIGGLVAAAINGGILLN